LICDQIIFDLNGVNEAECNTRLARQALRDDGTADDAAIDPRFQFVEAPPLASIIDSSRRS